MLKRAWPQVNNSEGKIFGPFDLRDHGSGLQSLATLNATISGIWQLPYAPTGIQRLAGLLRFLSGPESQMETLTQDLIKNHSHCHLQDIHSIVSRIRFPYSIISYCSPRLGPESADLEAGHERPILREG